jgi:hypothetical protein
MSNNRLPNALIRAFEHHFIYDREGKGRLYHLPLFIENAVCKVRADYKDALHVLKRFTGRLLGYLLKENEGEFTVFIPCGMNERGEILFLLKDSLMAHDLKDACYALKVVFIGYDTPGDLFHTVLFSGIPEVYFKLNLKKANIFTIDGSLFSSPGGTALVNYYCRPLAFPSFWKPYNPLVYCFDNAFSKGHHNEIVNNVLSFINGHYMPAEKEFKAHIIIR